MPFSFFMIHKKVCFLSCNYYGYTIEEWLPFIIRMLIRENFSFGIVILIVNFEKHALFTNQPP